MEPETIRTLITATLGGGGAIALFGLLKSLVDKWTGKAERERLAHRESLADYKAAVRAAEERADREEAKADGERRERIHYQEELSRIIQVAHKHGVPDEKLVRRPFVRGE